MKKIYRISDLYIGISGISDTYLEACACDYRVNDDFEEDISVRIDKTDAFIPNNFFDVVKIGESQYFMEGTDSDNLIFYDEKLCRVVACVEFNKSYDNVTITVSDLEKLCGIRSDKLVYNILGIAFQYIVRMKNGFVFHSSAIVCDNKGIAFSARSGIGKSTHTALWLKNIASTVMINDDTPVIRVKSESGVTIYGSPWAGTTGINSNISAPLEAVVFLKRSIINYLTEMPSSDALKLFTDAIRPSVTMDMYLKTLDTLDEVIKNVKMYYLNCNKHTSAAYTAKKGIFRHGG